jgi:hypothetical protein
MRIPKRIVRCVIIVSDYRIEGSVHLPLGADLSTFSTNVRQAFIPFTHVEIFRQNDNKHMRSLDLLEINRKHITMIYPLEKEDGNKSEEKKPQIHLKTLEEGFKPF